MGASPPGTRPDGIKETTTLLRELVH